MNGMMKFVSRLSCAAVLIAARAAHADLPPPDACQTVDAACKNAGAGYNQDGVCKAAMCTKGPPGQQITYECSQCVLPTTPSTAGAAPVTENTDKKNDGGCSVNALGGQKNGAALLFGLGLFALGMSRRRR